MTTKTLTDAEIDELSGIELDEAVCLAIGWKRFEFCGGREVWFRPNGSKEPCGPYEYHTDLGGAMKLLMGLESWLWVITNESDGTRVVVYARRGHESRMHEYATGPKSEAPAVFCRAFLKLAGRQQQ